LSNILVNKKRPGGRFCFFVSEKSIIDQENDRF
jgi:hypothetical protein